MKEQVKDGNVVEDSVSEYGDAMSSSSDSEDQDVAETPNGTQQNGEDLYEPLPLNSQNVKMPIRNLQDSETELWLVQVPRHQTLRESLKGSNVNIGSDSSEKTGLRNSNRKAGVFKGSYIFRDMGNHPVEGLRASFVCESEEGKSKLELGKVKYKSLAPLNLSLRSIANHCY